MINLRQAVDDYLALRENQVSARTYDTERLCLNAFAKYANANFTKTGIMDVKRLKPQHFEQYFYEPVYGQAARVEASTFNTRRIIINGFCEFLNRRGHNTQPLMENVTTRKVIRKEKVRLSPDSLTRLIENAHNPRDRIFIEVAINTALRQNEIIRLKIKDVNLADGLIFTYLSKNAKEDYFPINADLDHALRQWLTFYTEQVGPLDPEYYLIPAVTRPAFLNGGGQADSTLQPTKPFKWVNRMIKSLLESVGVTGKGEGVHTLRRSVAAIYYDMALADSDSRDDALLVTQALLNHSTVEVTRRYIGAEKHREKRDASLKGKPFLSSMTTGDNVLRLGGRDAMYKVQ